MRFYTGIYILFALMAVEVSCDCGVALAHNIEDGINADVFPWDGAVYIYSDVVLQRMCPVTLISSDVVMTAARCIYRTEGQLYTTEFFVVMGNYTPFNIWPNDKIQKSRVEAYHWASGYQAFPGKSSGDIAWLVLQHPLDITSTLRPACVDLENRNDRAELPIGLVGQVIYRSSSEDTERTKLRSMEVITNTDENCYLAFPEERRQNITLNPSCARFLTETSDFYTTIGTGFYSQHNGRWYLRAISTDVYVIDRQVSKHTIALMMNVERYGDEISKSGAIKKCGIAAPPVNPLIVNGFRAELSRHPWHVGIYREGTAGLHEQICGGSLISTQVVISAAHCFYDEVRRRQQAATSFAVAAGKFYRPYSWSERFLQKSAVETIHLPSKYYGAAGNYAEDIAWIILKHPFYHSSSVTPVCIDLDNFYQNEDLQIGRVGKVVGWGRTAADVPSNELQEMNVPYIAYDKCILALRQDFIPFITSDKFCAGYLNGTRLCDGDSGGGLVFSHNGTWFLRGIVSVGPPSALSTCAASYTAFTDIGRFIHEHQRIINFSTRRSS